ncbi:hypothetical protein BZZ01_09740 [Nostocales cyanobacterium HT-58-2]|nr:hypothetical protein BZZ01_09740 [Nostocales cyanobacterium HT-58-2]
MYTIGYLMRFLLLITLLGLTSCLSSNVSQVNNEPSGKSASEMGQTQENEKEDVSLDWFTSSKLKSTDIVSKEEAKLFVNNVYQTLDNNIFDPAFKKELRQQHLKALISEVNAKPSWSRSKLTELVNNQLKKLSISHVKILDAVEGGKMFRLFEQAPSSTDKSDQAISAQIRGEVGIVRVKSFIVPQINKASIEQAKAQLSQAKVILIDLRGNGGGDIPSLIEDIIGSDKVISTDRTRKGMAIREPYVFRGYYNDITGEAGIKLLEEKGYIQWRTRYEAKKDSRPYFILVDDKCGSACELFAAAAQENGGAKILGVRTMGALLAGEAFKLRWQGFALIAPTAQVFSPKGNIIEAVGVQPDIQISECKNSGKICLEKAIEVAGRVGSAQ